VGTTTRFAGFLSITDNFLVMTRKSETVARGWIDAGLPATS
jgi:hypothetical protein